MVYNIKVTLKKMEKIALKYEIMGSNTASKRKQMWTRFKWTFDWSSIENLRSKLGQHNTMMSLLLTQIGNSSLQKIQSSTSALEMDVQAIRKYISAHQNDPGQEKELQTPSLSIVEDDLSRSSLSTRLLKYAEISQPWSTVGVSQWIETGTWWLLRSQLETRPIQSKAEIPASAYASLIKASWILVDIIACHPQVSFVSSRIRADVST